MVVIAHRFVEKHFFRPVLPLEQLWCCHYLQTWKSFAYGLLTMKIKTTYLMHKSIFFFSLHKQTVLIISTLWCLISVFSAFFPVNFNTVSPSHPSRQPCHTVQVFSLREL